MREKMICANCAKYIKTHHGHVCIADPNHRHTDPDHFCAMGEWFFALRYGGIERVYWGDTDPVFNERHARIIERAYWKHFNLLVTNGFTDEPYEPGDMVFDDSPSIP